MISRYREDLQQRTNILMKRQLFKTVKRSRQYVITIRRQHSNRAIIQDTKKVDAVYYYDDLTPLFKSNEDILLQLFRTV